MDDALGSPPPESARPPPMTPRLALERAKALAARTLLPPRHSIRVHTPTPSSWTDTGLTFAWLGHATVLARIEGVTVLTDPALLPRVGFDVAGRVVGPARLSPPALAVEALPRLDVIAVSHAHADHLDLATLAALARTQPQAVLVVPTNCRDLTDGLGFNDVREVAVSDVVDVAGLRIEARRVQHYGRRTAWDRVRGRGYHGFLFEKGARSLFFGGDTAHTTLDPIAGGVDVAVFGIGGYAPYVWNHATPEQAWDMAQQIGARRFQPMHWATFLLSDEPVEEPIRRLVAVAGADAHRITSRAIGETVVVPA